jgi:hypothetical protein
MAGPIRHPIDQEALERFISQNVPEIKVPIDLKQVWSCRRTWHKLAKAVYGSLLRPSPLI